MKTARSLSGYLGAITLVALASLVCEVVRSALAPTNMVMAYLLAVVIAATRLGIKSAILTAFLSVLAFDFLFVPPRFSLRVSDSEYLVTFFALFVVGVVISTLVAKIQEKIDQVKKQEARTSSLYFLTRDLSVAADVPAVIEALRLAILRDLDSSMTVELNRLNSPETVQENSNIQVNNDCKEISRWVVQSGRRAGAGTAAFPESPFVFVPIKSAGTVMGVMIIKEGDTPLSQNLQIIEAFAGQAAMAFERVYLSRQAEESRILREKNNLEQALLNSVSHDLRTPLVTITGVLDMLMNDEQQFTTENRHKMLATAFDEANRLNRFVGSLLDMTRLEAGAVSPRCILCDVDEIIGCAIGAVEQRIGNHRIETLVEPDLPPVPVDLALLTQALVNLLDNAVKHSPQSEDIILSAHYDGSSVIFAVCDNGPGVPSGEEDRIFEKFHRITVPEKTGGTGLGLSIAKGIVEAHKGSIKATNRTEGGLMVEVMLPATKPGTLGVESH